MLDKMISQILYETLQMLCDSGLKLIGLIVWLCDCVIQALLVIDFSFSMKINEMSQNPVSSIAHYQSINYYWLI